MSRRVCLYALFYLFKHFICEKGKLMSRRVCLYALFYLFKHFICEKRQTYVTTLLFICPVLSF